MGKNKIKITSRGITSNSIVSSRRMEVIRILNILVQILLFR